MVFPMQLMAAAPNHGATFEIVQLVVGSALGLLLASLIHAALLLVACSLCRVPDGGYRQALATVLICNTAYYGFAALAACVIWVVGQSDPSQTVRTLSSALIYPVNVVSLGAAAVLGHAAVFTRRLGGPSEGLVSFGLSSAVAVVYLGLNSLVTAALWAVALLLRPIFIG